MRFSVPCRYLGTVLGQFLEKNKQLSNSLNLLSLGTGGGGKLENMESKGNAIAKPDVKAKLEELRQRDVEVASIARGLQMRTRITKLENEIEQLRAVEATWLANRLSRLYFMIPRRLLKLLRRVAGQ